MHFVVKRGAFLMPKFVSFAVWKKSSTFAEKLDQVPHNSNNKRKNYKRKE